MDLEQNTLSTQKWWGSSRSIPQGFRLVPEGSAGAEPHWSRGAHGAGSMWGKCCYLVEMVQVPLNYVKEGQMRMGSENMTSHRLGTAQCRSALTRTLKCLKGSQGLGCFEAKKWAGVTWGEGWLFAMVT